MRYLSLFSGYGGIDLALQHLGDPIAYVEIKGYCQRIISYRIRDGLLKRAPILADVKNIEGEIGLCDLIVGGFPCQDLSVAGSRRGLEGERSGLFYEIIRLTKEIRPKFVFLENVEGIRTKGLREVAREFTNLGYDMRWTRVSAKEVGANHRRNRWFGLAYSGSDGHWDENQQRWVSGANRQGKTNVGSNGEVQHVADSDSLRKQSEQEDREYSFDWISNGSKNESMANTSSERLQGLTIGKEHSLFATERSWWETEPSVGRVVDGPTSRVDSAYINAQIECLGNGVVPLQVRTAFYKLVNLKTGVEK